MRHPQTARHLCMYINYMFPTHGESMAKIPRAKIDRVASDVMQGYPLVKACERNRVSRSALYTRMGSDPEISNAIKTAQQQSAEKALEDVEAMYQHQLSGEKNYDPNVLRDYALHVRWKVGKVMPDQYGDSKNRAGVEVTDGGVKIMWEG